MASNLYWVSTLTYATVLGVILYNEIKANKNYGAIERSFRLMVAWVMFFCLQDTLWGLCSSKTISNDDLFFFSSTVFHCSTVVTTFFWLNYVLVYLGVSKEKKRLFLILDGLIIAFQMALLLMNFTVPTLFEIVDGIYITAVLRPLTFVNQYVAYLLTGLATFIYMIKAKGETSERHRSVVVFTLAPIVMGVLQLIYPEAPFYSLGYFLGCFVVHIFIVAKVRDDMYVLTRTKEVNAELANVYSAVANLLYSLHIIDLRNNSLEALIASEFIKSETGENVDAQAVFNKVIEDTSKPEYIPTMLEFVDLSTVADRLKGKQSISAEFEGKFHGWTRLSFISVEEKNELAVKVAVTTQIIDSEKNEMINLVYKSTVDELTGLYNRRLYEEELEGIEVSGDLTDIVMVAFDINGLKTANDTLGHKAGDELIIGAGKLINSAFSECGMAFRVGGDEFMAILRCDEARLNAICTEFAESISKWTGTYVKSVSISYGCVLAKDHADVKNIRELASMADKKMYEAKSMYYKENGIDRRARRS